MCSFILCIIIRNPVLDAVVSRKHCIFSRCLKQFVLLVES